MGFLSARGIFCGKRNVFKHVFVFLALFFILNFSLFIAYTPTVLADAPTNTPTPTIGTPVSGQWQIDPEVTMIGKNAERARQLLFWVFSHPGIHTAPVLAQLWAMSRNIVYIFVVIVLVAYGVGLIISRRRGSLGPLYSGIGPTVFGFNIPGIFFKLGSILLYATFSYLIVLALIQTSDIVMKFFIENVGGRDLFNVIFSGAGNSDANYTSFIGYRDISLPNFESAKTSIAIINFSSLTYFILSIILILRTIILWLLLVLSPFLALLMPFVFIRNVGWIWVGVFFQWLFYGPVVALFLAAVTKIWVAGIPYSFDFSRVNKPEGQVYRTAINILYGGPAQIVTAGNSANYIDTFAEYLISLIMLWAAMILPWLLLRIFRDYCCEAIATGNAALTGILDRIRQYPPPSPESPASPSTSTGMAAELPFRRRIEERIKEIKTTRVENIRNIQNENTSDLARSLDLAVNSLADLSRLDMNQNMRDQSTESLRRISNPADLGTTSDREKYSNLRQELRSRAIKGDHLARAMLDAATDRKESIASQIMSAGTSGAVMGGRSLGTKPSGIPVFMPTSTAASSSLNQTRISEIANLSGLSESKTREILEKLPASGTLTTSAITSIISSLVLSVETIKEVLQAISDVSTPPAEVMQKISKESGLSDQKIYEIWSNISEETSHDSSIINHISQITNIEEGSIRNIFQEIPNSDQDTGRIFSNLAVNSGLTREKMMEVVSSVSSHVLTIPKISEKIAQKSDLTNDKVREVITHLSQSTVPAGNVISRIAGVSRVTAEKTLEVLSSLALAVSSSPNLVQSAMGKTGLSESKVREVLENLHTAKAPVNEFISTIAHKSNLSSDKVLEIISSVSSSAILESTVINQIAESMGVSAEKVKQVMNLSGVKAETKVPVNVSIEDYEEVKKMWLKHYREAPVPVSEVIKTRTDWLSLEEKKLKNILELMSSSDKKKKHQGLAQVAEILPFMLLGGFSETEIITYIKAKHEAVKLVTAEKEAEMRVKEEMKKEIEENSEENMVAVGKTQETAAQEEKELSAVRVLDDMSENKTGDHQ